MSLTEDQKVLRDFAQNGAEEVFRTLATRYTDLVFGTAKRIVREGGAAEEVTQNVFITLARKAKTLPADTCLGAWLHQCAVLEAKCWVRGEVRRKQREEIGGGRMLENNESLLATLASALDESLLELREKDRAALLARFVQQKNLRDVGEVLGVSEDTAQKRVVKALEHLTNAFRKRGYNVPGVALTIAVLEGAVHAAPVGLIGAAAAAGLSASASISAGSLAVFVGKFMSLTKTQTITVCALLGAGPVAYQWQANQPVYAEQVRLERQINAATESLRAAEATRSELARTVIRAESDVAALRGELRRAMAAPQEKLPADEQLYAWSEKSEYVRLRKELLEQLKLTPMKEVFRGKNLEEKIVGRGEILEKDGTISPVLLEALGLNRAQQEGVQRAFFDFAQEFDRIAKAHTQVTNVMPPGVRISHLPDAPLVTLRTVSFAEEGWELRAALESRLRETIGPQRAEILLEKQAKDDLQVDFLGFGKYENWVAAAEQGGGYFSLGKTRAIEGISQGGSVSTVPYEALPEELKAHLPAPLKEGK